MKIKGLEKLSFVDYPHHLACVIFLAGCNMRCHYCYNHKLVMNSHTLPDIPESEVLQYIEDRKKLLEGICVSGGEPTVHKDLPEFIKKLRAFGLPIKLDTNGTNPQMIAELIKDELIDYVALDIKAPLNCKYLTLTHVRPHLIAAIKETIHILTHSSTEFEFRTTVIPKIHDADTWHVMREQVMNALDKNYSPMKVKWFAQPFIPSNCLDPHFNTFRRANRGDLQTAVQELKKSFPNASMR